MLISQGDMLNRVFFRVHRVVHKTKWRRLRAGDAVVPRSLPSASGTCGALLVWI